MFVWNVRKWKPILVDASETTEDDVTTLTHVPTKWWRVRYRYCFRAGAKLPSCTCWISGVSCRRKLLSIYRRTYGPQTYANYCLARMQPINGTTLLAAQSTLVFKWLCSHWPGMLLIDIKKNIQKSKYIYLFLCLSSSWLRSTCWHYVALWVWLRRICDHLSGKTQLK
jgi:hypothetical protein